MDLGWNQLETDFPPNHPLANDDQARTDSDGVANSCAFPKDTVSGPAGDIWIPRETGFLSTSFNAVLKVRRLIVAGPILSSRHRYVRATAFA